MSTPIKICRAYRAARGDEAEFESLAVDMTTNMRYGHYMTFGCNCTPPCVEPTPVEMEAFNQRLAKEVGIRLAALEAAGEKLNL